MKRNYKAYKNLTVESCKKYYEKYKSLADINYNFIN